MCAVLASVAQDSAEDAAQDTLVVIAVGRRGLTRRRGVARRQTRCGRLLSARYGLAGGVRSRGRAGALRPYGVGAALLRRARLGALPLPGALLLVLRRGRVRAAQAVDQAGTERIGAHRRDVGARQTGLQLVAALLNLVQQSQRRLRAFPVVGAELAHEGR